MPADFDASVGDDDGDDDGDGDGDGDDTYRVAAKVELPPPSSSVAGIPVLINKSPYFFHFITVGWIISKSGHR